MCTERRETLPNGLLMASDRDDLATTHSNLRTDRQHLSQRPFGDQQGLCIHRYKYAQALTGEVVRNFIETGSVSQRLACCCHDGFIDGISEAGLKNRVDTR